MGKRKHSQPPQTVEFNFTACGGFCIIPIGKTNAVFNIFFKIFLWFGGFMTRPVPKKMSDCIDAIHTLWDWNGEKDLTIAEQDFEKLTYAAKKAAEKAGLAFRAGGLHTKNNRLKCMYIFFPGKSSIFYQNGSAEHLVALRYTRIFRVSIVQAHPRQYRLQFLSEIDEVFSLQEIVDKIHFLHKHINRPKDLTIQDSSLKKFFSRYIDELIRLSIISPSIEDALLGWHVNDHAGERRISFFSDASMVYSAKPSTDLKELDSLLPSFVSPSESLFLAATLFSLCKPLFSICRIKSDTDFVVQLLLKSSTEKSTEDCVGLWVLEQQLRLWCNYREWPQESRLRNKGSRKSFKFRNSYNKLPPLLYASHLGFPIVCFNYKKRESEEDSIEYSSRSESLVLSKDALNYLCSAACLPILVSAFYPDVTYPAQKCLTISTAILDAQKMLGRYEQHQPLLKRSHENINAFYMSCMQIINNRPCSEISKLLKSNYRKASAVLAGIQKEKDVDIEHLACILGTLYFIFDVLEKEGVKAPRLRRWIQVFCSEIGIVTLHDFAVFIAELLQEPEKNSNVLFGRDKDGIYLYYQTYWKAFQKYCQERHISLTASALSFRRTQLIPKKLVRAQYAPSPGGYTRYDYRKKLNGKEATVLNLSPRILDYLNE